MSPIHPFAVLLCIFAIQSANSADAPECKRFDQIYPTGKELCEKMWDGAFVYETDEEKAYTMWFFDNANPNDATAKSLGKLGAAGHDTCHLSYFHKDKPGPEPDNFTECHPWKNNACCAHGTVETFTKLKEGYGKEYHWDRCGPISPECERFFVQEACFYECDPNAGLYRAFHPSIYNKSNESHNEWQVLGMPIKKSYCDAWFTACRNDKFCASDGGSFFSCAAEYEKVDELAELQAELAAAEERARGKDSDGVDTEVIIGFICAGVLIFALLMCGGCLIMKEKAGKPVFGKLLDNPGTSGGGHTIGNQF
jgi:folate receptor